MNLYYKYKFALAGAIILYLANSPSLQAQTPSSLPSTLVPTTQTGGREPSTQNVERISTYDAARLKSETSAPAIVAEPPLRTSQIDDLKKRAQKAVFAVKAYQDPSHRLAMNGTQFDGACAALARCPDHIDMSVPASPTPASNTQSSSFFDRGLDKVSSPFAAREATHDNPAPQPVQCYITTADWLTNASRIEIIIHSNPVEAIPVLRDDRQNVLILKTAPQSGVQGLEIAAYDAPQSPSAFALINPGSMYENFSQQSFVISAPHLYGMTTLTARNGYPLINSHGELVGLAVSQTVDRTRSNVVHYQLIDRALYPEKYDRSVTEKSELTHY